jgi:hypothetical protein
LEVSARADIAPDERIVRMAAGREVIPMSGFSSSFREDDPVQTVRTIARIAQMLIELRDEYVERPREDILAQIEQRLDDMLNLREELRHRIEHHRDD